jgi:hypothetical protein
MATRSEPRIYPFSPQQVFGAALSGLPGTKLIVKGADPAQGTIWAEKGMSAFSWGEKVTIYVYPGEQGQTTVTVDSALNFGLFSFGAHARNHQAVFEAIERGLGLAPAGQPAAQYPQEQAPGPYPYQRRDQQQPEPAPDVRQPPPGATTF